MGEPTIHPNEHDREQAKIALTFAFERAQGNNEALFNNLVDVLAAANASVRQANAIVHKLSLPIDDA